MVVTRPSLPSASAEPSCVDALANATSTWRHAALRESIVSGVGTPTVETRVLVLNTIDRHYTHLIQPWAEMVASANFAKRIFVVAMDAAAADASRAASIAHFAPPSEPLSESCTKHANRHSSFRTSLKTTTHQPRGGESASSSSASPTPVPGSYRRIKIQGKEADTRILPPDLPSWKFHSVRSGLSLGWRVLFSETDVLWMPSPALFADLLTSSEDYAPQRHPMTPVYNFGFFFAQGARAESFFGCLVHEWERRTLRARTTGAAVEIASDQRFLYDTAIRKRNSPSCGPLSVRKLSFSRYPTCRAWIGGKAESMHLVHLTYCHRLSMLLSSEDVCKKRLVERYYLEAARGGVSAKNLTSKAWNVKQGC